MEAQERWYQTEAAEALDKALADDKSIHPVVIAPTGTGKTHIIAKFVELRMNRKPDSRILILSHVTEVLGQNYKTLCQYYTDILIGLYSSSYDSKELKKITVAGIQSIYRSWKKCLDYDVIIIDEAHGVNNKEKGMYRNFLKKIPANYVGLTATAFRMGGGYIYEGETALFNKVVYDLSEPEKFRRLQDEGYLSKVFSKGTAVRLKAEGIPEVGGDYKNNVLSDKFDRDEITRGCVAEIVKFGKNRKRWLIFAIDISHAEHIKEVLTNEHGISCNTVHSNKTDTKKIIKDYNAGIYKAIINVNMLTTGFDEPSIDLIGMMRPTCSPVIHVQAIGRGLRVVYADGYDLNTVEGRLAAIEAGPKQNCLVLDFPDNTDILGPIDDVYVRKPKEKKKKGQPIIKECPECQMKCFPSVKFCPNCNFEFLFEVKLNTESSDLDITTNTETKKVFINDRDDLEFKKWVDVREVEYYLSHFRGRPNALRIIYRCDELDFEQKMIFNPKKYESRVSLNLLRARWKDLNNPMPTTPEQIYAHRAALKKPTKLYVDVFRKYKKIVDYDFILPRPDYIVDKEGDITPYKGAREL